MGRSLPIQRPLTVATWMHGLNAGLVGGHGSADRAAHRHCLRSTRQGHGREDKPDEQQKGQKEAAHDRHIGSRRRLGNFRTTDGSVGPTGSGIDRRLKTAKKAP